MSKSNVSHHYNSLNVRDRTKNHSKNTCHHHIVKGSQFIRVLEMKKKYFHTMFMVHNK